MGAKVAQEVWACVQPSADDVGRCAPAATSLNRTRCTCTASGLSRNGRRNIALMLAHMQGWARRLCGAGRAGSLGPREPAAGEQRAGSPPVWALGPGILLPSHGCMASVPTPRAASGVL